MQKSELQTRITDLEQRIAEFPAGSVTKKTISGRVYFYRRWTEDKKRKEKYTRSRILEKKSWNWN